MNSFSNTNNKDGNDNMKFMSNFSLGLIHRIMLTDPNDFPSLTMNGLPRAKQMYFLEFVQSRDFPISLSNLSNADQKNEIISPITTTTASIPPSSSIEEQISKTMHRAYNNMIIHEMEQKYKSYKPIQNIMLEIHAMLRSLVPNRPDLHDFLKDEDILDNTNTNNNNNNNNNNSDINTKQLFTSFNNVSNYLLNKIGHAMSMLESEYRCESTKQWMDILNQSMDQSASDGDNDGDGGGESKKENNTDNEESKSSTFQQELKKKMIKIWKPFNNNNENQDSIVNFYMTPTSFILASCTFLHYKAELCQTETADFQLSHILAPKISKLGKEYLLHQFQQRFVSNESTHTMMTYDDDAMEGKVPNMKVWIEEIIKSTSCTTSELLASEDQRGQVLVQTGWIDNILFRSPRSVNEDVMTDTSSSVSSPSSSEPSESASRGQFLLPEILWLDTATIRDIRMTTRISVVGSVLALHAVSSAGANDGVFKKERLDPIIEECKVGLTTAMNNRSGGSQDLYENNICYAVVKLAKALGPNFVNEQSLVNRTKATLKGEDPVIKLLDNRMRDIFRTLVVCNPQTRQQVPTNMRSGRQMSLGGRNETSRSSTDNTTFNSLLTNLATEEFIAKGFGFYAKDLAEASVLACRTINLVLNIHGAFIDKIFVNKCNEIMQS